MAAKYNLVVSRRERCAFDALVEGRLTHFEDAERIFETFDRFVHHEIERRWDNVLDRFGDRELSEFHEFMEEVLPHPGFWTRFWDTSAVTRLFDPEQTRVFVSTQLEAVDRFGTEMDRRSREYLTDLLQTYEQAYAAVHEQMWDRLYG
jgi:hypothetical protein